MKNATFIILAMNMLLVFGCHSRETLVTAGGDSPGIIITNAPDDAVVFVDNHLVGEAEDFDGGRRYLALEPGVHTIVIRSETGTVLEKQTVFLEGEVKTIQMASYKD